MTDSHDSIAAAASQPAPGQATAALLHQTAGVRPRDAQSSTLQAALLDSAGTLLTLRSQCESAGAPMGDTLGRCELLLARAVEAARAEQPLIAWDCLQQVERERVPALSDDQRRAEMVLVLAESRELLGGWRQDAAEALAASARGEAPGVAVLQALLRNVHGARQDRRLRLALVRQQMPMLGLMLTGAVAFFGIWGLLGGFDWLARDDVDVTVGMMLVSGVLMGYFGGLMSFAFGWLRSDLAARVPDLRTQRWLSFTRPMIGAAVAVPIVLLVEAGLVNIGQLSPALVLALCLLGGFSERWFIARMDRLTFGRARRQ
jgi:hypothetical protein